MRQTAKAAGTPASRHLHMAARAQPSARAALSGAISALAVAATAAGIGVEPVDAATGGMGRPAATKSQAADELGPTAMRVAQAAVGRASDSRTPQLQGRPGEQVPLTHALVDMAASSGNYVIVNKAPAWMSLSPAESIGSGVWLIAPNQLGQAHIALSPAARGAQEVSIAVVGPGGAPIAEAKMLVTAIAAGQPQPPATTAGSAVTSLAAIAATPAAAATATTALQPPAAAVPPPAPPAAAATAAQKPAQPTATVAQNTAAPSAAPKDGTKAWTEFLGGAKQGGQPKPGPAGRAPAAAQKPTTAKSEAELIGYAKHLVRECTTCHSLYGQDIGIPLMVGLAKDRFLDTMELYKIGKRDNAAMASVAQSLTEEETLALAIYLGRIKPPPQAPSVTRSAIGSEPAAGSGAGLGFQPPPARLAADSKDQARVERWLKRGQQMLEQGEVSQARLLLTRAAELGDARAALMLATSYDPNALPWRQNMGPEAEPARAKELYQLAIRLGAGAEAERRLQELP